MPGGLTIVNDDVLHTRAVPDGSIDLAVTSPPYNVGIDYGTHDDHTTYRQYLAFSRKWLARCHAWLAPGGRLCLNVPLDKNKGGQQSVGADLTTIAKDEGFRYHATIVWNEGNISRRTAWGSWLSPTAPYVIAPVELIVVLYKGEWRRVRGERTTDIERDEFMAWTNGLWTFPGERKSRIGHPAPFPLELPRRCIRLFSFVEDTVLDPFMGSGTTLLAARRLGRKAIGIDLDPDYCRLAKRRLAADTGADRTPRA
jgi:site-specific DNA-methyltransferase (adenine-specific)